MNGIKKTTLGGCSSEISSPYFFVQVKFGACYIKDLWGEFRVDDLSNFCNKMLTNQKPKLVIRKCQ